MTDKEKIREEVVGIINSINLFTPDEDGKNSSYEEGRLVVASQILQIIDSLQEEPVSNPIDFEKELYKAFGQVKDFTLGMQIAKWFYDMGKNSKEPISEDLEQAAREYAHEQGLKQVSGNWESQEAVNLQAGHGLYFQIDIINAFKSGAQWQKLEMMKYATEVTVHIDAGGYPYTPEIELYDYDKDVPLAKEGDKYKVVLIK